MAKFMACHETSTRRPRFIPIGDVTRVEPDDPARAFFASTTITLKSGERVHVTEQPAMVRCMAYNPLWIIDA